MKIFRYDGTPLIIPREHIPFILIPSIQINVAWTHINMKGELFDYAKNGCIPYMGGEPLIWYPLIYTRNGKRLCNFAPNYKLDVHVVTGLMRFSPYPESDINYHP